MIKQLRMHSSIWELESFYAPKDVIIIGSGLAGLWSAYYLKKKNPKLNITIVDKGIIPSGASMRNAGFACYGSMTELLYDARTMGTDKMQQLVSLRFEGLSRITKTLEKKFINYKRNGGFELINDKQYNSVKDLKKDIDWLNQSIQQVTGNKNVFKIADKKIKKFGFNDISNLVENETEAQLHSGKMIIHLLSLIQSMGVMVLNNVDVKNFTKSANGICLETNLPVTLKTDQLLICTNAWAKLLVPGVDIIAARGQVLVTSPIKNLKFKGTFHYDEGFYYFRNIGKKILLGGARNLSFKEEETLDHDISPVIQDELERFLREVVLPGENYTIDLRWSGIMGMGNEKIPTINKVEEGVFCAVGLGGMGVTLSPLLGEQAAKMMFAN
jgi:glycine/D-amino acid oxidase-like deaminating enzyme